jgi:spore coat polysaccharide biosynthesis protein SpsF (cytidylyltransferase family)
MNTIGIIIQARLGSKRLPGKMILPFFNEKGIFELITEKIKKDFPDFKIVVATSTNTIDNELENMCNKLAIKCFRGSENNVLDRFINAAESNGISKIIRICADNPFLNMVELHKLVDKATESTADYISFQTSENKPTITTHYGFWAEVVTIEALRKVQNLTTDILYQEHVTNFIYANPQLFNIRLITIPKEVEQNEEIRMTLDTQQDFNLLKEIYSENSNFNQSPKELIDIVTKNQNWLDQMKKQILKNQK